MRPLSPCLVLAAGLVLAAAPGALAGPRAHGAHAAHGFASPGARAAFLGHRPGSHDAWLHRHHRHHRWHHRVGHLPRFGGFWPGYSDVSYGAPPAVVVQQNVALAHPGVPEVIGIRSAPAAAPVVYVIKGRWRGARPLVREGRLGPSAAGPRVVEVRARRVP